MNSSDKIKRVQKTHYNELAESYVSKIDPVSYEYYFEFTKNAVIEALRTSFDNNITDLKGLDLGCGIGDFTAAIAQRCGPMVGTDISAGMINVAQKKHRQPQLTFEVKSSESDHLATSQFDFCMSIHLFHHLASQELVFETVQEMQRVTKPGGKIFIVDVNKLNPVSPLIQYLMVKRGVDTGDEKLISPKIVRDCFQNLGIKIEVHRGICFVPHIFPKLAKFNDAFGRIFPDKIIGKDYLMVGTVD